MTYPISQTRHHSLGGRGIRMILLSMMVAFCACNNAEKQELISKFYTIESDLALENNKLLAIRSDLAQDSCVIKSGLLVIMRMDIIKKDCYKDFSDDLAKVLNLGDFISINIEENYTLYLLKEEIGRLTRVSKYYVYNNGGSFSEIFTDPTQNKEKLAENWWYIEERNSLF